MNMMPGSPVTEEEWTQDQIDHEEQDRITEAQTEYQLELIDEAIDDMEEFALMGHHQGLCLGYPECSHCLSLSEQSLEDLAMPEPEVNR